MTRFRHFLAIDWSGARGERQKGIALALCGIDGPPVLLSRDGGWSRAEVTQKLESDLPPDTLVGLDLGIALPFADCGAYFPGLPTSPADAPTLWALVETVCADAPHLEAGPFVDHPDFAPYFRRHGGREGASFRCDGASHGQGRFRVTEQAQATMGCRPTSNFNLVGASQVGKSSLTGMRMLHRLRGVLPVWPIDPLPGAGSVVVEIYITLAAMAAGRRTGRSKMRSVADLNAALVALGSSRAANAGPIDEHASDALLAAAWLRRVAHEPGLWSPPALTHRIARTEGWTFGAL